MRYFDLKHSILQRLTVMLFIAILPFQALAYTVEEVPNVHVADRTKYVSNPDGILSPQAVAQADSIISSIWKQTSAEVVAVAVNSIGDADATEFATALYTHWGIGKKDNDNGLLILVVKDSRKVVLRTGYGMEGILPDALTAHIWRDDMIPYFRKGDFDSGMIAGLQRVQHILTTPGATEELMSKYANDRQQEGGLDLWEIYKVIAVVITLVMAMLLFVTMASTRRRSDYDKYQALDKIKVTMLATVFIALGMPLILFLILIWRMKALRNKPHKCPSCGHKMRKLDEETDNQYLSASQDLEEKLNAIDYDVWMCPDCGATEVIPYINRTAEYTVCPNCKARTCVLSSDRILKAPTAMREGIGEKEYTCRNCHSVTRKRYSIPASGAAAAVAAGAVIGSLGGRGDGGGFSGGSFGGGMTGGGGSTGDW